jgi:hypothetical protein
MINHIVDDIVLSLTGQELREFRYFLASGGRDSEGREDLKLVECIRNHGITGVKNVNADHQTRKRLKKQLEQFAMLENLRHDEFSRIQSLMETARFLFRKNLHRQAWDYLIKAEQAAIKAEEYRLLDYNYDLQITYSYNITSPPPPGFSVPDLIKKWEYNRDYALIDSSANTAYAHLIHEVREQFSKQLSTDIDELSRSILKRYNVDDSSYESKLRIYCKIVHLVCRALREKREYASLKAYSIASYQKLVEWKSLDRIQPDFLIDLLDTICVAALRSKDYVNCEQYTRLYEIHAKKMLARHGEYSYYDFIPAVGVSDICICTNRLDEARVSMLTAKKKYANYSDSARIYFLLRINLISVHFSFKEYAECIKLYNQIKTLSDRQILGEPGFRIELILFSDIYGVLFHYEDGDADYALYLLNKLKRKHAVLLGRSDSKREKLFLKIIEQMLSKPSYLKTEKFMAEAQRFISMKEFVAGDFEYISMNAWLRSKMTGRDYYSCFLEMVN